MTGRPEVKNLIEARVGQVEGLASKWPITTWRLLTSLEKPDRVLLYRSLPRMLAAEVFFTSGRPTG